MPPEALNTKLKKDTFDSLTSPKSQLTYAIDNNEANIEDKVIGRRKNPQHVVAINNQSYLYNPLNIAKLFTTKLRQLTNTKEFEATLAIKQVYQNIRLRISFKSYAMQNKAVITDIKRAVCGYLNAYTLWNTKFKLLKVYRI